MMGYNTIMLALAGVAGIIVVFFAVGIHLNEKKRKEHAVLYIKFFEEQFQEVRDIRKTLMAIQKKYKAHSVENEAIGEALDYLDHSILRDYKTALGYIERIFRTENVVQLHENCINTVSSDPFRSLSEDA